MAQACAVLIPLVRVDELYLDGSRFRVQNSSCIYGLKVKAARVKLWKSNCTCTHLDQRSGHVDLPAGGYSCLRTVSALHLAARASTVTRRAWCLSPPSRDQCNGSHSPRARANLRLGAARAGSDRNGLKRRLGYFSTPSRRQQSCSLVKSTPTPLVDTPSFSCFTNLDHLVIAMASSKLDRSNHNNHSPSIHIL